MNIEVRGTSGQPGLELKHMIEIRGSTAAQGLKLTRMEEDSFGVVTHVAPGMQHCLKPGDLLYRYNCHVSFVGQQNGCAPGCDLVRFRPLAPGEEVVITP